MIMKTDLFPESLVVNGPKMPRCARSTGGPPGSGVGELSEIVPSCLRGKWHMFPQTVDSP